MTDYQKRQIVGALPTGTNVIGSVKITDGTETATVNASNFLETSPEHSLKGKTILYDRANATNGTGVLRTVTAGKTYYLLEAGFWYKATTNNAEGKLYVSNANQPILYMSAKITATYWVSDTDHAELTYPHPLPIAAGVSLWVSASAGMTVQGWIIGWEE